MKLEATRYMRMPFFVTGHQVTKENMEAVAQWCEGHVIKTPMRDFIRVPIIGVKNIRQTEAQIGDHVLKTDFSGRVVFKIEKDAWISDRFIQEKDLSAWVAENFINVSGFERDPLDDIEIEDIASPNNVRPLPSQFARPRSVRAQR